MTRKHGCTCADPVWECCDEDIYCSQCGQIIAWLESPQQEEPVGVPAQTLWVYANAIPHSQARFVAGLTMIRRTAVGSIRRSAPVFQDVRTTSPWQLKLEEADRYSVNIVFVPPDSESSVDRLSEKGDGVSISLRGDFGNRNLSVRLFEYPHVDVQLKGRGIARLNLEDVGAAGRATGKSQITDKDVKKNTLKSREYGGLTGTPSSEYEVFGLHLRDASMEIRVEHAPIRVLEDVVEIETDKSDRGVILRQPLLRGTEISPDKPFVSSLDLTHLGLDQPGDECRMSLHLPLAGLGRITTEFVLRRVEKGIVSFEPAVYVVEEMFEGEIQSNCKIGGTCPSGHPVLPALYVANSGGSEVRLKSPVVENPCNWLKVRWAGSGEQQPDSVLPSPEGELILPPDRYGQIRVDVDLSKTRSQDVSGGLSATVIVGDATGVKRDLEVHISSVRKREVFDTFLAIDFGNSYSYAAMFNPGPPLRLSQQKYPIVAAHDLEDRRGWPTALFFNDLSDPKSPSYVIGDEAVRAAQFQRRRLLVSDLKRWLADAHQIHRTVEDAYGNRHTFKVRTLICLYLEKLIQAAQLTLRKGWIKRVGLTCPARFTARQRRALNEVLEELSERSRQGNTPVPLEFVPLEIDEATALAIGAVFDPEFAPALRRTVDPENPSPSILVASFDLGGGSLDTGLHQIKLRDYHPDLPFLVEWRHLGRGGDERFGGDNVTAAVYEILIDRLKNWLASRNVPSAKKWLAQIPSLDRVHRQTVDPLSLQNYHILWLSSEIIKLHLAVNDIKEANNQFYERTRQELRDIWMNGLHIPRDVAGLESELQEFLESDQLPDSIDQICDHALRLDMWGTHGKSARERIEAAIDELIYLAKRNGGKIDFVILGGAGSRLPIVRQLWHQRLNELLQVDAKDRIWFTPESVKSSVAFGLSRYLDVQHLYRVKEHSFDSSFNLVNAPLGVLIPGFNSFIEVVPNGSRVDRTEDEYPIWINSRYITLDKLGNPIKLWRRTLRGDVCLGHFELPPPLTSSDKVGILRFAGAEKDVELWVYTYDKSRREIKLESTPVRVPLNATDEL